MFNFTNTVPPINGRAQVNKHACAELLDALLEHPNEWAQVPITYLIPDLEGVEDKILMTRARSIANRVNNRQDLKPFNEYPCECKSRGTDIYIRINLTRRQLKEMEL